MLTCAEAVLLSLSIAVAGVAALPRPLGPEVTRDLGRLLFALLVLWAYLDFMQMLIIWNSDLPDEAGWYLLRLHGGWAYVAAAIAASAFRAAVLRALIWPPVQRSPVGDRERRGAAGAHGDSARLVDRHSRLRARPRTGSMSRRWPACLGLAAALALRALARALDRRARCLHVADRQDHRAARGLRAARISARIHLGGWPPAAWQCCWPARCWCCGSIPAPASIAGSSSRCPSIRRRGCNRTPPPTCTDFTPSRDAAPRQRRLGRPAARIVHIPIAHAMQKLVDEDPPRPTGIVPAWPHGDRRARHEARLSWLAAPCWRPLGRAAPPLDPALASSLAYHERPGAQVPLQLEFRRRRRCSAVPRPGAARPCR